MAFKLADAASWMSFGVAAAASVLLAAARASRPARAVVGARKWHTRSTYLPKLQRIVAAGPAHLQLLFDFDRTCTTYESESAYGVIEEGQPQEFRDAARRMYEYYHAIEVDPHMSIAEKIPHMKEWYERAHELFVAGRVAEGTIKKAADIAKVRLRPEFVEILALAEPANVPVVIFSAGIANVIEELLRKYLPGGRVPSNVHVVSNRMVFAPDGVLSGWDADLIHMYNKNESHLRGSAIHSELCARRNVVLAGDSTGDATMADGLPHETVLKVGIVNTKPDVYLHRYLELYDAAIVDADGMQPLLDVVRAVLAAPAPTAATQAPG